MQSRYIIDLLMIEFMNLTDVSEELEIYFLKAIRFQSNVVGV